MLPPASVWDAFAQRCAETPGATAIVDERGHRVSWAELAARVRARTAELAAAGVGPGSVVSWQLPSWIATAELTLALAALGAVQNPIVPILRDRDVAFITAQAGATHLVVPPTWRGHDYAAMAHDIAAGSALRVLVLDRDAPPADAGRADAIAPMRDDGGVRWLFYTSGTTAEPKGARHADAALLAAAGGLVAACGMGPGDRLGSPAPMSHIGGIAILVAIAIAGTTLLIDEVFDPARTSAFFSAEDATLLGAGTPFFLAYLDAQATSATPLFPHVRCFLLGGAPKPPSLNAMMRERFGAPIVSGYGLTECPMLAWNALGDADDVLATTEGRAIEGVDLRVVDGEVRVRGPQLMAGYVDAALDAEAFDDEGYLRTGDLGALDAGGNLTITGRSKDVIIRNMENVSAKEVEDLLFLHADVADCAVVGVPDARVGERVCVAVVARDPGAPPTLHDLCAHLDAQQLSRRKHPEQLQVMAALPRNGMGKVLKAELREAFA
ncbi:MAG TPA: AMP-binding protein [Mycobacteriales bacterium]|nr:AMP-binding protein [Mycobacteriales bacterium]